MQQRLQALTFSVLLGLGFTLALLWFLGAGTIPTALAATFTVTKATDTNHGTCNADCSLREAVVAANASPGLDTITLSGVEIISNSAGIAADGGVSIASVDLQISKRDSADPVLAGANLVYTLRVTNTGSTTATGVVVTDTLPPEVTFVSAKGGSCSHLGGTVTCTLGNILLVDDDEDSPDVRSYYTSALNALGYTYDIFDVLSAGTGPTATLMSDYDVVIWFSGELGYPDSTDEAELAVYLDNGGRLFLSSQDYYFWMGNLVTSFMQNYLGLASVISDTGVQSVIGANDFAGLGPYTLVFPFAEYPDDLTPNITGTTSFNGVDGGSNPITTGINTANTVFFGFPWEAIQNSNPAGGEEVMQAVVDYLMPKSGGSVRANQSRLITLTVTVDPAAGGVITNTAEIAGDPGDTQPLDNSTVETTTILSSADLVIIKDVFPSTVPVGRSITYTLAFVNNGSVTAAGVVITDTPPIPTVTVTSIISSGGPIVQTGGPSIYTFDVGDVAPGDGGILTMTVNVNAALANGVSFTNTAEITGTASEVTTNNTATAVVTTETFNLGATKQVDNSIVTPGMGLTYTVIIANQGTGNFINTTLTDTIPAEIAYVPGSLNTQGSSPATFDGSNITWSGTVAGNQAITFTFQATVTDTGGFITNTAIISHPNLTTELTPSVVSQIFNDQDHIYTDETDVSVPDDGCFTPAVSTIFVPDSFAVGDVRVGVNMAAPSRRDMAMYLINPSGTITVTLLDAATGDNNDLDALFDDAGGTIYTGTHNLGLPFYDNVIQPAGPGMLSDFDGLDAQGTWTLSMCNFAVESGSATLNQWSLFFDAAVDLSLSKSVMPTVVVPGDVLTYTLAFSNTGEGTATNVIITDIVPSALSAITYQLSVDSGVLITPTLGLTYEWMVSDLAQGQGGVITITGQVNTTNNTTLLNNTATITAASDINVNNNSQTVPVTVVPVTLTVNTTDDNDDNSCTESHCSLREAINTANANTGVTNTIAFSIAGSGPHTIVPTSTLPVISEPVIIDGLTEPGASCATWPPTLLIEVAGSNSGSGNGLEITAGNATIQGLVINRFSGNGVRITANGNNRLTCNFIGTNVAGSAVLSNAGSGIIIENVGGNTIGGGPDSERNLISGNGDAGVEVKGAGAAGNLIANNYIGTNVDGTAALGNINEGLRITDGAAANVIGTNGDGVNDAIEGNLLSGNVENGVLITGAGSNNNRVAGNFIGTNAAGTGAVGNGFSGILIETNATGNIIGSNLDAISDNLEVNLISGNGSYGIHIAGTHGNTIAGNNIGTNAAGTADLGNMLDGIILENASSNVIGGLTSQARNLIAGNNVDGIHLTQSGTTSNTISGNLIGTNINGTVALSNTFKGVTIADGASNNTVGGLAAGALNLISGNGLDGVKIEGSSTSGNLVQGNYIGTNLTGMAALGNGGRGVAVLNAPGNTIGGNSAAARNLISGNSASGVTLEGSLATNNFVQGNYIGTDVNGTAAISNSLNGVFIAVGASNNTIGGTTPAVRNLISGNGRDGVGIDTITSTNNTVSGNHIGTDVNGTAGVGNKRDGVRIDGAMDNIIGVVGTTGGNLISGNDRGIFVGGATAGGNIVQFNRIGTTFAGTAPLSNSSNGITIDNSPGTVITANLISANGNNGILIAGASATTNTIQNNRIGIDFNGTSPLGNAEAGVSIILDASNNVIGGPPSGVNEIAYNGSHGVNIAGSGTGNAIRANSVYSNTGLGINLQGGSEDTFLVTANDGPGDLDPGPNDLQNYPVLNSAILDAGNVDIIGVLTSTAGSTFTIEFFANTSCDPSGYGEGEILITTNPGIVTSGSEIAAFNFSVAAPSLPFITATATDSNGNTSEFSACIPVTGPADLVIDKGVNPTSAAPGQTITYTLKFANTGSLTATNVVISDTVPIPTLTNLSVVSSGVALVATSGVTYSWQAASLGPGQGGLITVTGQITGNTGGIITNTATITSATVETNTLNNKFDAPLIVTVPPAGLSISGPVLGVIGTNYGFDAFINPIFTVTPITYIWQATDQGSSVIHSSGISDTVGFTWNSLGTKVIIVTATNSGGTVTATHLITIVANSADLEVTKIATPNPAAVGGTLNYQIVITNNGPLPATGVTITDTLPTDLSFAGLVDEVGIASVTCALQGGNLFICNVLSPLNAGDSLPINLNLTPNTEGSVVNSVDVSANEPDSDMSNNTASVNTTVVNASGDLIVTQSAIPDPVTVGQPLLYTVIVTNQGPSSVSGVTIVDFLPADVVFNSFSHSTGVSCVAANGAVTCGQSTLAANAQASVTIAVTPTAVGSITNTVSASVSVGNDPNLNNNSDIVTTSVSGLEVVVGPDSPPADLTFTNLAGDPTTISIPGGAVSETIRLVYAPVTPSAGSPGGFIFTGHAFTLDAYAVPGGLLQNYVFSRPLTIDITYSDNDVSSVNDENALMLYYLNGSNWVDVATTCVPTSTYQRNTNANTLAVDICHLTEFGLFGPTDSIPTYLPIILKNN